MDLISRQVAIEALKNALLAWSSMAQWRDYKIMSAFADLPSVQSEIIRCKDCKHWREDHTCREHSLVSPMTANEFCSRAEGGAERKRMDGRGAGISSLPVRSSDAQGERVFTPIPS